MFCFHESNTNFGAYYLTKNLTDSEIMKEHLMKSLVKFYVDIEFSGSSNQFYEKFNFRFDTASVFDRLWKINFYKQKLKELVGTEYLEKFINSLLNDTSYCLEEGLTNLEKIKEFELKFQSGNIPNDEERKDHK